MKCSRCQHDNPADTRFCGQCAALLASVCPVCGAVTPPDNRFCGQCAAPLRPAGAPTVPAPEIYTPRYLAEKILTSKNALEGERNQVTVLFADVKSSTELLADRDPEEARKLLDPVLERMVEAVHRYEGTVNHALLAGAGRGSDRGGRLMRCSRCQAENRESSRFGAVKPRLPGDPSRGWCQALESRGLAPVAEAGRSR
jgi:hypothetical protein